MPTPLQRRTKKGEQYFRPPEIEESIQQLEQAGFQERLQQFEHFPKGSPRYAPSEALVYFMRRAWTVNEKLEFKALFDVLIRRIEGSLLSCGAIWKCENAEEIRAEIRDEFVEMIAEVCCGKHDKLDFYEIRFDKAFSAFRTSQLRRIGPTASPRIESIDVRSEAGLELPSDAGLGEDEKNDDLLFRWELDAAIDKLPEDQRLVIGLLRQGFPIGPKDEKEMSIARMLGCDERTVRNRRDRAQKTLKGLFQAENGT